MKECLRPGRVLTEPCLRMEGKVGLQDRLPAEQVVGGAGVLGRQRTGPRALRILETGVAAHDVPENASRRICLDRLFGAVRQRDAVPSVEQRRPELHHGRARQLEEGRHAVQRLIQWRVGQFLAHHRQHSADARFRLQRVFELRVAIECTKS